MISCTDCLQTPLVFDTLWYREKAVYWRYRYDEQRKKICAEMRESMSKITESGMSQSESLIMDYLWKEGTGKTFAQIMAFLGNKAGKEWAKQTVNTFLRRLIDKGVVRTESIGRKKVYFAAQTVAEYEKQRTKKLLDDLYEGSIMVFLSALTGGKQIDEAMADNLRSLINEGEEQAENDAANQ